MTEYLFARLDDVDASAASAASAAAAASAGDAAVSASDAATSASDAATDASDAATSASAAATSASGASTSATAAAASAVAADASADAAAASAVDAAAAAASAVTATGAAGLIARDGSGNVNSRTLTGPAAGIGVSNGTGASGNPTLSLTNDLSALEALASTGFAARTTTDTWAQRTLTAPAAGLTITNPAGIAGDPTFALANDLSALEALASNGLAKRTGTDTWAIVTAPSGTVVGTSDTQTLTNKRIDKRIGTTASSATPTPDADAHDQYNVTAQAEAAAFGAPTGTPTDGQRLTIRIKDNGTARALSWNAAYRALGITLPTTTVLSKTLYVGFIWNAADSTWDGVAKAQQA